MKSNIRQLLADLKAAALIGDPDALAAVLAGVRRIPDSDLAPSTLVPLGTSLAALDVDLLAPWFLDPDAAVRGITAAALGAAYAQGREVPMEILYAAAADPAGEVRAAFVETVSTSADPVRELVEMLLLEEEMQLVESGLEILGRTGVKSERIFETMAGLDSVPDHDVRSALVTALAGLANLGWEAKILEWLDSWAGRETPNVWVITRAASSTWAQAHSDRVLAVLDKLAGSVGRIRPIKRATARLTGES